MWRFTMCMVRLQQNGMKIESFTMLKSMCTNDKGEWVMLFMWEWSIDIYIGTLEVGYF